MPNIRPELSAQGFTAPTNPMLRICLSRMGEWGIQHLRAADQGCGRLRHLAALSAAHEELYLIDTHFQLEHRQLIAGVRQTIPEYVDQLNRAGDSCRLYVVSATDFASTCLGLDVIYSIATFDVVPMVTRESMVAAAAKNLRRSGLYIVIVPRNDSSILRRCTPDKAHQDGYLFERNDAQTFYCNFRNFNKLIDLATSFGFKLFKDLSVYRQVVLIFERS